MDSCFWRHGQQVARKLGRDLIHVLAEIIVVIENIAAESMVSQGN